MTINEQLGQTAGHIREASDSLPIPTTPVSKSHRTGYLIPIMILTAVVAATVTAVWPIELPQTASERSAENVDLVRAWVEGALEGDFDRIAELTHGEQGEPAALAGLAKGVHRDRDRYGDPGVRIWSFDADETDLEFVCLSIEFSDATVVGGMVLRFWEGLGRRLWEFRSAMEGCTNGRE